MLAPGPISLTVGSFFVLLNDNNKAEGRARKEKDELPTPRDSARREMYRLAVAVDVDGAV